jgi:hypothetical protein
MKPTQKAAWLINSIMQEKAGDMNNLSRYPSQFSERHNYAGSEIWINEIHVILKFDGKLDLNKWGWGSCRVTYLKSLMNKCKNTFV